MSGRTEPTSGTTFAAWYFIGQGVAVVAWWAGLAIDQQIRALFVPPGASEIELLAFALPDLLLALPASVAAGVAILRGRRAGVVLAWITTGAVGYAALYCVAWAVLRGGAWVNVMAMVPAALLSFIGAIDVSASKQSAFRRAAPAPTSRYVAMTLAQTAVFWAFFLFMVPPLLVSVERRLPWHGADFRMPVAAAVLFAACSALGLASGFTMATRGSGTPLPMAAPNRLVTAGPYGHVRNPMVIAGLGQGLAVALWFGSWTVLGYVLAGGILWQILVRPAEERDLRDAFGDSFTVYCRHVACWVPRLRAYRPL
jgi:protein-S-isoprenylcysteine O-methyltransferase Ste14